MEFIFAGGSEDQFLAKLDREWRKFASTEIRDKWTGFGVSVDENFDADGNFVVKISTETTYLTAQMEIRKIIEKLRKTFLMGRVGTEYFSDAARSAWRTESLDVDVPVDTDTASGRRKILNETVAYFRAAAANVAAIEHILSCGAKRTGLVESLEKFRASYEARKTELSAAVLSAVDAVNFGAAAPDFLAEMYPGENFMYSEEILKIARMNGDLAGERETLREISEKLKKDREELEAEKSRFRAIETARVELESVIESAAVMPGEMEKILRAAKRTRDREVAVAAFEFPKNTDGAPELERHLDETIVPKFREIWAYLEMHGVKRSFCLDTFEDEKFDKKFEGKNILPKNSQFQVSLENSRFEFSGDGWFELFFDLDISLPYFLPNAIWPLMPRGADGMSVANSARTKYENRKYVLDYSGFSAECRIQNVRVLPEAAEYNDVLRRILRKIDQYRGIGFPEKSDQYLDFQGDKTEVLVKPSFEIEIGTDKMKLFPKVVESVLGGSLKIKSLGEMEIFLGVAQPMVEILSSAREEIISVAKMIGVSKFETRIDEIKTVEEMRDFVAAMDAEYLVPKSEKMPFEFETLKIHETVGKPVQISVNGNVSIFGFSCIEWQEWEQQVEPEIKVKLGSVFKIIELEYSLMDSRVYGFKLQRLKMMKMLADASMAMLESGERLSCVSIDGNIFRFATSDGVLVAIEQEDFYFHVKFDFLESGILDGAAMAVRKNKIMEPVKNI